MNTEQCKGCGYWKPLYPCSTKVPKACHYMLMTDERRKRTPDGKCLSWSKKAIQTNHINFLAPNTYRGLTDYERSLLPPEKGKQRLWSSEPTIRGKKW